MELEKTVKELEKWLDQHKIEDVEIIVGDFAGISRGKNHSESKICKSNWRT